MKSNLLVGPPIPLIIHLLVRTKNWICSEIVLDTQMEGFLMYEFWGFTLPFIISYIYYHILYVIIYYYILCILSYFIISTSFFASFGFYHKLKRIIILTSISSHLVLKKAQCGLG